MSYRIVAASAAAFGFLFHVHAVMAASPDAMFRGDPAHTGVYDGTRIGAHPALKWSFHTSGQVYSSPAVADGTVFAGSTDGHLYAIDLASGKLQWQFTTGARITSSPAVSGGMVFFESYDGNFYGLDEKSGALKWKFVVAGERRFAGQHLHGMEPAAETMPDPFDVFLSSPAVSNNTVFFGSGTGNIYALDAATGVSKWEFATANVVHASPAVADGMLFVGSWDSYFYALDATTGALKWRFKTGEDSVTHNQEGIQSSAAVSGGLVYFGCRDSNLYALDEKTGAKRWVRNNKGSWVIASPAIRDGLVYAATSDSGQFFALDAATGAEVFSLQFNHWPMFSSPALAGDFAYIGSHQGKLLAIDVKQRQLAWEFQTAASARLLVPYSNPQGAPNYYAVQAGNFYDEMVVATDKMAGLGQVFSSPVIAGKTIVFGATDGNIYALE